MIFLKSTEKFCSWDTCRTRRVVGTAPGMVFAGNVVLPGGIPGGLRLGTRGTLGRHPEGFSRFGHSGHVAHSEGFRSDLSA